MEEPKNENEKEKKVEQTPQNLLYEEEILSIEPNHFEGDNYNDFKCTICLSVPKPDLATEEVSCGKVFCKKCIEQWVKENQNKCPTCKQKPVLRNIKKENILVYKYMNKFKLECLFQCGWKGQLKDFFNQHIKECQSIKHSCKYKIFGCSFEGNKTQIEEHEKEYKLHLDLAYKNSGKPLQIMKDTIFKKGKGYKVSCHPHELIAVYQHHGWACNGKYLEGGCVSGITGFYQTEGMEEFRCDNCDFDLCHGCLQKYIIN